MTVAGLVETGHSEEEAKAVMRKAVALAASASSSPSKSVALALGPYGASLRPGAEYSGIYPGVYGTGSSEAVRALADWHAARLRVYAEDENTWNSISYIAFETIPNFQELYAIRCAMALLPPKPFWITMCFPGGKHPSGKDMPSVVGQLVGGGTATPGAGPVPKPNGIGVNCTNPQYLAEVIGAMTTALKHQEEPGRYTLVVYPDGGAVYDPVTRTWQEEKDAAPSKWAMEVVGAVSGASGDVWTEAIVGGCCKSSFDEVKALRDAVDTQGE